MKIAIPSRAAPSYSTRRLVEAATDRDHEPELVDVLELAISLEQDSLDLYSKDHPLPDDDALDSHEA